MHHEFRTSIGIITGFAELMLETPESGGAGPVLDWTRDTATAAAHLLELLEDSTRYAALHRPDQVLKRSDATPAQVIKAALLHAAAALERAQVTTWFDAMSEVTAVLDHNLVTEAIGAVLRQLAQRAGAGAVLQVSCDAPACVQHRVHNLVAVTGSADRVLGSAGRGRRYDARP